MSTTFTIDNDNNITAFAAAEQAPEGHDHFTSEKDLAKLAAEWPISRLVDIWNGFAGVVPFDSLKPVKKFMDRKSAVARIWKAVQALTPIAAPPAATRAPKRAKATKEASKQDGAPVAREGSTKAVVLQMLKHPDGATLSDIQAATGWAAHYADVRIMPTCVGNPVCGAGIAAMESA